jgi:hypothetical protein
MNSAVKSLDGPRRDYLNKLPASDKLNLITYLHDIMNTDIEGQPQRRTPPEIATALDSNAHAIIRELRARDRDYLRADAQIAPATITVHNPDLIQDALGIDDVQGWVKDQIDRYPRNLTVGLRDATFAVAAEDNAAAVSDECGRYDSYTAHITTFLDPTLVDIVDEMRSEGAVQAHNMSRGRLERQTMAVNDHEIGHHIYSRRLPLTYIEEWGTFVRDNPRYPGEWDDLDEAFAQTVEDFMNTPWTQRDETESRFTRINDLWERYSDSDIAQGCELEQTPGMSTNIHASIDMLLRNRADRRARGEA